MTIALGTSNKYLLQTRQRNDSVVGTAQILTIIEQSTSSDPKQRKSMNISSAVRRNPCVPEAFSLPRRCTFVPGGDGDNTCGGRIG